MGRAAIAFLPKILDVLLYEYANIIYLLWLGDASGNQLAPKMHTQSRMELKRNFSHLSVYPPCPDVTLGWLGIAARLAYVRIIHSEAF